MTGLDLDARLAAAFNTRAAELPAHAEVGDARGFALQEESGMGAEFGLVLAPMQLLQLLADGDERVAFLRCAAAHLGPGGRVALAIVEGVPDGANWDAPRAAAPGSASPKPGPPLPDVREVDGWVYSSLPLETALDDGAVVVRRLRQTVSPGGELDEELDEVRLRRLDAATVEREAKAAGLRSAGRREIRATDDHVGSTVVLLEREA